MTSLFQESINGCEDQDIKISGSEKTKTKSFSFHTDDIPWSTGVTILCPLVDMIHIVDPKLSRLHLFPAWREPFPLQRVAPVCSVSVVVDVVLPATDGPVNGPAGRKGEVLSR